jgi:hypothetical protein
MVGGGKVGCGVLLSIGEVISERTLTVSGASG